MKGAHHIKYRLLSGNQNDFILKFSLKRNLIDKGKNSNIRLENEGSKQLNLSHMIKLSKKKKISLKVTVINIFSKLFLLFHTK